MTSFVATASVAVLAAQVPMSIISEGVKVSWKAVLLLPNLTTSLVVEAEKWFRPYYSLPVYLTLHQ